MATKNLKYFMRPELKEEQIVEVPGPIKDENGEPIMFQIKKLSQRHIDKIYDRHKVIRNALDKKGKPYIVDGKIVKEELRDNTKAYREVLTESIVFPDVHDNELLALYGCVDSGDLLRTMFTPEEYSEVVNMVNGVLGLGNDEDEETEDDIEKAKN